MHAKKEISPQKQENYRDHAAHMNTIHSTLEITAVNISSPSSDKKCATGFYYMRAQSSSWRGNQERPPRGTG